MSTSKYLISIINHTIKDEILDENNLKTDFNEEKIYKLAKFHSVDHLLYYQIHLFKNVNIINAITKSYMIQVQKAAVQDAELETICETLEQNHIKYMPLKGSIMKHLYPSFEMRSMSDLDILYDVINRKKLNNIFKELGYERQIDAGDSHHDVYFKRPFMNLEMHKEMIDDVLDWSKYYLTIWDNVIKKIDKEYEYYLSNEDFYIFHICHAGKHASNGGTGIRTIIDEYLFIKKYNDLLNWEYIKTELDKLNLTLYEQNIKNLAFYWFENAKFDSEYTNFLEDLTEFIVNSGTYGTSKQHMILRGFASDDMLSTINKSRFKYFVYKMFPPYREMKRKFTILGKCPILLPILWIYRIIRSIFRKDNNAFTQMNTLSSIKEEEINRYKDLKEKTGL